MTDPDAIIEAFAITTGTILAILREAEIIDTGLLADHFKSLSETAQRPAAKNILEDIAMSLQNPGPALRLVVSNDAPEQP